MQCVQSKNVFKIVFIVTEERELYTNPPINFLDDGKVFLSQSMEKRIDELLADINKDISDLEKTGQVE